MFCSTSLTEHLLRGALAALLLAGALLGGWPIAGQAVALLGAFLLMRGCPMCWLMGLIGTTRQGRAHRQAGEAR